MTMTPAERRAVHHGVPEALARTLHAAAVHHSIPYSIVLAVCQHESGFRNVWGHDPGKFREDGVVTAAGVARYFAAAPSRRPNGVGPMQITSPGLQSAALEAGGLHDPAATSRVAVDFLAGLMASHGQHEGVKRYNGSGPAAELYAIQVLADARIWHAHITDARQG